MLFRSLFSQGILAGALDGGPTDSQQTQIAGPSTSKGSQEVPLFLPEELEDAQVTSDPDAFIDPALLDPSPLIGETSTQGLSTQATLVDNEGSMPPPPIPSSDDTHPVDAELDNLLANEVSQFLTTTQGTTIQEAVEHAEAVRHSQFTGDDELLGLDEDELDAFLLTDEEVKIKERVWVELNKDYLEALAGEFPQFL